MTREVGYKETVLLDRATIRGHIKTFSNCAWPSAIAHATQLHCRSWAKSILTAPHVPSPRRVEEPAQLLIYPWSQK